MGGGVQDGPPVAARVPATDRVVAPDAGGQADGVVSDAMKNGSAAHDCVVRRWTGPV